MDPQQQAPIQAQNEQPNPGNTVAIQVAETIQNSKNVLVTVGANPTVDELASALGLTFLLGKLDKHATAVFSGKIPPAMEFLDPEKTFEDTVDSLRDFIIALDKEKADKLRYKVEDDVVKIFITPYRTTLSEADLQFSQGDFNVDAVIALGVTKREELDKAIVAHGRILHDATVVTVNVGAKTSSLGSIDWSEPEASSVAEMMVNLSEALGGNLLDGQISTAFLTGIVAETNRFSNEKTSPRVMSLSAQLMAAGANQQLIATNLRQEGMISEEVRKKETDQPNDDNGEMVLDHSDEKEPAEDEPVAEEKADAKTEAKPAAKKSKPKKAAPSKEPAEPAAETTSKETKDLKPSEQLKEALERAAEPVDETAKEEAPASSPAPESLSGPKHKVVEPLPSVPAGSQAPAPPITPIETHTAMDKPTFGGTLNATTAGAEESRAEQQVREAQVNNIALSHDEEPEDDSPAHLAAVEEARKAVEDASEAAPLSPVAQPLHSINAQPLPAADTTADIDTGVSAMQSSTAPVVPSPAPQPQQSPVDAFMQPHTGGSEPPLLNAPTPTAPPSLPPMPGGAPGPVPAATGGLPPLPPMPGAPTASDAGALPPLPPLPGQPVNDQTAAMQPQINPGFMQNMPQSQNTWTQAGDDLAAQQAGNDAARQEKMDKMTQQYDQAVDRNREIQGLPPLNNPNGSGLPPLPPANL